MRSNLSRKQYSMVNVFANINKYKTFEYNALLQIFPFYFIYFTDNFVTLFCVEI